MTLFHSPPRVGNWINPPCHGTDRRTDTNLYPCSECFGAAEKNREREGQATKTWCIYPALLSPENTEFTKLLSRTGSHWPIKMIEDEHIWMVVVGFLIAFILAFGIGANDVANSFGTSVGSKVLTLKQACILASVFETLGAVLLGAKVSDTIRKGIIDTSPYQNETEVLMVGNVAALAGSCTWLITATLLRLPVSATHSIVGATVGFAVVAHGANGINWSKFAMIVGSWFVSPILAGAVSTAAFFVIKQFILNKSNPLESGLKVLPFFYAVTIIINLFSVFYDGPEMLHFDRIPLYGTFILSFGSGIICAVLVWLLVVPWLRNKILRNAAKQDLEEFENGDPIALVIGQSASNSQSSSSNTSRRSSLDEKKAIVDTAVDLEEKKDAANYLAPPEVISLPNGLEKKSNLKQQHTMHKNEDAPLMDNEYNLGNSTPVKSPTMTDMNAANQVLSDQLENMDPEKASIMLDSSKEDHSKHLERGRQSIKDKPETVQLFSFLQILTAVFGSFAHGGNDVSNAIGPLVSLWLIATHGEVYEKAATPFWILLFGGVGISLGLCLLGRRVIKTLGEDLTKITPSSGFCIEIGSAFTVLVASNLGIPISTTHCKVGSVVAVGRFRSKENVDWSIFRNIILAWIVTLPVCGGVSAAIFAGLRLLVVPH